MKDSVDFASADFCESSNLYYVPDQTLEYVPIKSVIGVKVNQRQLSILMLFGEPKKTSIYHKLYSNQIESTGDVQFFRSAKLRKILQNFLIKERKT